MFAPFKKISSWSLPSRASYWSFWLAVIATPGVIIGYFQFFGNDQIREPLLRALQASLRPEVRMTQIGAEDFIEDGRCLVLTLENISMYPARNMRWQFPGEQAVPARPFKSGVLNLKNIQISAKSSQKLALCTMADLELSLRRLRNFREIVGFRAVGDSAGIVGLGLPFVVRYQFDTDAGETITKDIAIYAFVQ